MVTFANMDRFASDAATSRIVQREPMTLPPLKELRLGDVLHVDGEDWTIWDFDFDTQSVYLCRGKRFNYVKIQELA